MFPQRKKQTRKRPRKVPGTKVNAKKRTRGTEITWKEEGKRKQKRKVKFTGSTGVKCNPDDPRSALSIFKLFFTDKIVNEIVRYTNEYANTLINMPKIMEQIETKFVC